MSERGAESLTATEAETISFISWQRLRLSAPCVLKTRVIQTNGCRLCATLGAGLQEGPTASRVHPSAFTRFYLTQAAFYLSLSTAQCEEYGNHQNLKITRCRTIAPKLLAGDILRRSVLGAFNISVCDWLQAREGKSLSLLSTSHHQDGQAPWRTGLELKMTLTVWKMITSKWNQLP